MERRDSTTLEALRARRQQLSERLGGIDALIFAGAPVARNFAANTYSFRASSHFLYLVGKGLPSAVLLLRDADATLFLESPAADDAIWHGEAPSPETLAASLGCEFRPRAALVDVIGGRALATLAAVDAATRSEQIALLGREPGREPTPEDERLIDAMVALRLRHDPLAIAGLRRAAAVTRSAHLAGRAALSDARHEREVRAAMEAAIAREGCEPAYPSIVTVHGEVLHQRGSQNAIRPGELLLADVGAETPEGYAGDVTRTWPTSGRFSASQAAIYQLVVQAQQAAIDRVRPGVRFREVHLAAARALTGGLVDLELLRGDAEELVEEGLHALFFPHGVGHLLGLDVHDMEDLGDRAGYPPGRARSPEPGLRYLRLDRELEPGMAVTIEPGFYRIEALLQSDLAERAGDRLNRSRLEAFSDVRGIRIEDNLLVTAEGAEILSAEIPKAQSSPLG